MSQQKLKDLIDSYNIELLKNASGSALRKILLEISKTTIQVRKEIANNHKPEKIKEPEGITTEEVMDERSLPIILNGKTPRLAKITFDV